MKCTIPFFHKVRHKHEKFYEYVINIEDGDGVCKIIHRRYNHFFNFQHQLLELFPKEAGVNSSNERVIPNLPGKVIIRTEKERQVAANRRPLLETYCNSLFRLPPFIWRHRHVVQFFACTDEDVRKTVAHEIPKTVASEISAPSALELYRVTQSHSSRDSSGREFSAKAGDTAAVLRCTDTGYWLVDVGGRVGWFPAAFLSAPVGATAEGGLHVNACEGGADDAFVCVQGFKEAGTGVSVFSGELLVAVERRPSGWWSVRRGRIGGLLHAAPAVNLRQADPRFIDRGLLGLDGASSKLSLLPQPVAQPQPPPTQTALRLSPALKPPRPPPPKPSASEASETKRQVPRNRPQPPIETPEGAKRGGDVGSAQPPGGPAGAAAPSNAAPRSGLVKSMASRFESG